MNTPTLTKYPLGGNLFAFVKTSRKNVKIHVRHYTKRLGTTGNQAVVVPTQRGVVMDLREFQQLLHAQKRLCIDYYETVISQSQKKKQQKKKKKCSSLPEEEKEEEEENMGRDYAFQANVSAINDSYSL